MLSGSLVISLGLTLWIKKTAYREFNMLGAIEIALASFDFGSDVLFIFEAYENKVTAHALMSTVVLALSCIVSFGCCFLILLDQWQNGRENFNWECAEKSAGSYGALLLLSATNIELVQLFPWKKRNYDGFPLVFLLRM